MVILLLFPTLLPWALVLATAALVTLALGTAPPLVPAMTAIWIRATLAPTLVRMKSRPALLTVVVVRLWNLPATWACVSVGIRWQSPVESATPSPSSCYKHHHQHFGLPPLCLLLPPHLPLPTLLVESVHHHHRQHVCLPSLPRITVQHRHHQHLVWPSLRLLLPPQLLLLVLRVVSLDHRHHQHLVSPSVRLLLPALLLLLTLPPLWLLVCPVLVLAVCVGRRPEVAVGRPVFAWVDQALVRPAFV